MKKTRLYLLIAICALFTLGLYGCLGSDDNSTPSSVAGALPAPADPANPAALPDPVDPAVVVVPDPTYSFTAKGGNAAGYNSAGGGDISIYTYGVRGVSLNKDGSPSVDTSFALPTITLPVNLGTDGWTPDASTTVLVYLNLAIQATDHDGNDEAHLIASDGTEGVDPGEVHFHYEDEDDDPYLYQRSADGTEDIMITGMSIPADITVTLGLNIDRKQAEIIFSDDVRIEGTLKTTNISDPRPQPVLAIAPITLSKGALSIFANRFTMSSTGVLDTSGDDAPLDGGNGGNGGAFYLLAIGGIHTEGTINATGGNGFLQAGNGAQGNSMIFGQNSKGIKFMTGYLVNTGTINSSGGDGIYAGNAGNEIKLDLDYYSFYYGDYYSAEGNTIFNTGNISANGGNSTAITEDEDGQGGNGGTIRFLTDDGSIFNSGNLSSNGGNGAGYYGNAGDADNIYMETDENGHIINSGAISAKGGNSTEGYNGGSAGNFRAYPNGGDFRSSGDVTLAGGNSESSLYSYDCGGRGGNYNVRSYDGHTENNSEDTPPGSILITGNINLNGGDGDCGADAGDLDIYISESDYDDSTLNYGIVALYGYTSFDLRGGNSTNGYGGSGGDIDVDTEENGDVDDDEWAGWPSPAGPIFNNVDVVANGGNGWWEGGDGGDFYIESEGELYLGISTAINLANINVSGGDALYDGPIGEGEVDGGDAGEVFIFGYDGATHSGDITATGGNAVNGWAGDGLDNQNDLEIGSAYNVSVSGTINGNAGNGAYGGQNETNDDNHDGNIDIWAGNIATVSGTISLNGGDSTDDGIGEGTGTVSIQSAKGASIVTAAIEVKGGTGVEGSANNGKIFIDFADVTTAGGTN